MESAAPTPTAAAAARFAGPPAVTVSAFTASSATAGASAADSSATGSSTWVSSAPTASSSSPSSASTNSTPSSSASRSEASVLPSLSASAALANHSRASSSRPAVSSASAYAYRSRAVHGCTELEPSSGPWSVTMAASICPMSRRAPAATIRISTCPALSSFCTSGSPAMAIARSGRPRPRSQSAITGHSSTVPVIRRVARNSASASVYRCVAYAAKPAASRTAATREASRSAMREYA